MSIHKNIKLSISIIILILGNVNFVDAQNELFIPHSGYSLKLEKKKDFLFSIGGYRKNKNPLTNIFQFQIGYSPINHLSISIFCNKYKLSSAGISTNHNNFISGINIGTYFYIRKILLDLSSGYSIGRLKTNYTQYTHPYLGFTLGEAFFELNIQKYYFQGGIHLLNFKFIHLSGIYRLGKVNYYKGILEGQSFRGNESNLIQIVNQQFYSFNEIAIKFEVIKKPLGLYFQITDSKVKNLTRLSYLKEVGLTFDISAIRSYFLKMKRRKKSKNKND